jgi:hypothetical protein
LTDKERIEAIKQKAKRNSYQLAILSFIGVFGFLIAWQAAVLVGWLPKVRILEIFCKIAVTMVSRHFVK